MRWRDTSWAAPSWSDLRADLINGSRLAFGCGAPSNHLLVEPVALDDLAAHPLHARFIGSFVSRIQPWSPALLRRRLGSLDVEDVEARGDACVLVLGLDSKREDADPVHLALAEQEA